jgi:hypothetical protein
MRQMIQPNSQKILMSIVEIILRHYDLRWATEVRRAAMLKPKVGYKLQRNQRRTPEGRDS